MTLWQWGLTALATLALLGALAALTLAVGKQALGRVGEQDRGGDAERDRPGLTEDLAASRPQDRDHVASGAGAVRSSRWTASHAVAANRHAR